MELTGLQTIQPQEEDRIVKLSEIAGAAFVNEAWTTEILDHMPAGSQGEDRRNFLSQVIIMNEMAIGVPRGMAFTLPDDSVLAIAYQNSELHGMTWEKLRAEATDDLIKSVLSDNEAEALWQRSCALRR